MIDWEAVYDINHDTVPVECMWCPEMERLTWNSYLGRYECGTCVFLHQFGIGE